MKAAPLRMSDVAEKLTMVVELQVTAVRWWSFRVWLGSLIMRLAARVIGCSIEIKGGK